VVRKNFVAKLHTWRVVRVARLQRYVAVTPHRYLGAPERYGAAFRTACIWMGIYIKTAPPRAPNAPCTSGLTGAPVTRRA